MIPKKKSNRSGDTEWPIPLIDAARCTGCGLCVKACPTTALSLRNRRAVVSNPYACTYSGSCELICPEGAITHPFQVVFVDHTRE